MRIILNFSNTKQYHNFYKILSKKKVNKKQQEQIWKLLRIAEIKIHMLKQQLEIKSYT